MPSPRKASARSGNQRLYFISFNFLDIQALEALEQFIMTYEGTIIFVTHDKNFIANVADLQFTIESNKIF
ncbi:hypothetical protein [Lysinibacillus sp. Y5S-8]|uniref:hypothetical protein n=1 Tax=Lysinibacillus sp. Y5S-8 TaxID=3122488 RepID=UPI0030D2C6A3